MIDISKNIEKLRVIKENSKSGSTPFQAFWLGTIEYSEAYALQMELKDLRIGNKINNILLLQEHPHVFTLGKSGKMENIIDLEDCELFRIERGGDVTYHGPGQLVAYPIFNIRSFDLGTRDLILLLENAIMGLLANYAIQAHILDDNIGVFVHNPSTKEREKIAALGLRLSRWVSTHGLALNINTDLNYFDKIIPCGIVEFVTTSMKKLSASPPTLFEAAKIIDRKILELLESR